MDILHTPLFASEKVGAGFHNVGGSGVLRASNEAMVKTVELHYGERCGHLPLTAERVHVLVSMVTTDISTQMAYLSQLFGRAITAKTFAELEAEARLDLHTPLIVPYINIPETDAYVRNKLGGQSWGLSESMTNVLKNKADFYQLVDELGMDHLGIPDYRISHIDSVAKDSHAFLTQIEDIYKDAGLASVYPLGVVLRAAESDGNYGCCLVHENNDRVVIVQNGDGEHLQSYTHWEDALAMSQGHLAATMNTQREPRVVISRYMDLADSPGMSVVVMNGEVVSLGWNGQYQKPGSKACVGTNTYKPKDDYARSMKAQYEDRTASTFENFLRQIAARCSVDFASVRGVANIDIMLPGELERRLQQQRKQPPQHYLAECNPRWTNYTDAIMTILGATRRIQTIYHMQASIAEGISTVDKYPLPIHVNPRVVRERVFERDAVLQRSGTRIICRMTKNPLGVIFAGDIALAQRELDSIIADLSESPKS